MEYYGSTVPMMFRLVQEGDFAGAMDCFWQIHPARLAAASMMQISGSNFAHRYVWKYMGWLNGFNGGPLRMPTMRISPAQMRGLRRALEDSGLDCTSDTDDAFFVGRNPG